MDYVPPGATQKKYCPDQVELAYPAHHMVFETTSCNQGSELSSSTMIPQMTVVAGCVPPVATQILLEDTLTYDARAPAAVEGTIGL